LLRFTWTQDLFSIRPDFEKRSHLDRNPAGDDGFASPGQRFVHVGAPEDPEAADVFLGFEVGAVGDGDVAVGSACAANTSIL
jgi:hypothetical protein